MIPQKTIGLVLQPEQDQSAVARLKTKASRIAADQAARRAGQAIRAVLLIAVVALISLRIHAIGLRSIVENLPTQTTFYICFIAYYMTQPLGEYIIYRRLWGLKAYKFIAIFLRKRVYNFAVLAYSGEAFLFMWARSQNALNPLPIMSHVKDNVILSALASNALTVIMVAFFLATGQMQRFFNIAPDIELYFAIAGALAVILVLTVLRFRGSILAVGANDMQALSAIHTARLLINLALQSAMWAIALPGVPLETWLVILTLQLALTRIPFLPNQDLVFLALVMSVTGFIEAPEGAVAGVFITLGALTQLGHLASYVCTSINLPRVNHVREEP